MPSQQLGPPVSDVSGFLFTGIACSADSYGRRQNDVRAHTGLISTEYTVRHFTLDRTRRLICLPGYVVAMSPTMSHAEQYDFLMISMLHSMQASTPLAPTHTSRAAPASM